MPTRWIQHVKEFQQKHNCSYKDAMVHSKASYTKDVKGGSIQSIVKKGKKLVDRGKKEHWGRKLKHTGLKAQEYLEEATPFAAMVAPEIGASVAVASRVAKRVNKKIAGRKR